MDDDGTWSVGRGHADPCERRRAGGHRRLWTSALLAAIALYAAAGAPAVAPSPAIGDMSLLNMQRIKSYVDDTCTLDPHCQWTWDETIENGLKNVSVEQAAAMLPYDYLFPPGNDTEKPGQRGKRFSRVEFG